MLRTTALLFLLLTPAFASDLQITDVTPTFWGYWDKAEKLPRPEQVRLFKEMVVARHPELYNQQVIGWPPAMSLDVVIDEFLDWAPPHFAAARRISGDLQRDLPRYVAQFQRTFPDFRPDTPVIFMISLRGFDGAVRRIADKPTLLFGVEMIAAIHGPAALKPFFEHELFHRYHAQVARFDSKQIWWALWGEGLATYVAQRLNPKVPLSPILGRPPDLEERTKPLVPKIAAELLAKLDATDDLTYRQYFFGQHGRTDIPQRTGYYLGFLIAKELGDGKELAALARLSGPGLRAQIRTALERLSQPRP